MKTRNIYNLNIILIVGGNVVKKVLIQLIVGCIQVVETNQLKKNLVQETAP